VRSSVVVCLVSLLLLALFSCREPTSLLVDLRSDFVSGAEVVRVSTEVSLVGSDGAALIERTETPRGSDLLSGFRIADIDLDAGTYEVIVSLRGADDAELVSRRVIVGVLDGAPRGVTVVVTRSCTGVVCDGEETCEGGRCVDVRCSPENPSACPAPMCAADGDCMAMGPACFVDRCSGGVCFSTADDGLCDAGQVCEPTGCTGAIVDAGMDAAAVGIHHGWTDVVAHGAVVEHDGTRRSNSFVRFAWREFTTNVGAPEAYVVSMLPPGGSTMNVATMDATTLEYFASDLAEGEHTFSVHPIVGGEALSVGEAIANLRIVVPPDNMVLVHRWIANQAICQLMSRPADSANDYRCQYRGPGSVSNFYDLGSDLFVDRFETGCAFSLTACGGGPCLGVASPDGVVAGSRNTVFYDRSTETCWINADGGTSWLAAEDATDTALESAVSNAPGLPPLVRVNQAKAAEACRTMTVDLGSGPVATRLLHRRWQIPASLWSDNLSDAEITDFEDGTDLPTTGECNVNGGDGLTYEDAAIPTDFETLPSTNSSAGRAVITGSNATRNCISRFGAQDFAGNAWEWLSDQAEAGDGGDTYQGITSAVDPSNDDFDSIVFDENAHRSSAMAFFPLGESEAVVIPLGLPIPASLIMQYDGTLVGPDADQIAAERFHDDIFHMWARMGGGEPRGAIAGGRFIDANAGVWNMNLNRRSVNGDHRLGLRCAVPIP